VDIDSTKIENLKKGILPIYEPGLDTLVTKNIAKGRLKFSTSLGESIKEADVAFIAVGTPPGEDGSADLKYVIGVAQEIGQHMNNYGVIVTKSTVPVGTAKKVQNAIEQELSKRKVDIPFDVASNPEFLKEGAAIDDFLKPDIKTQLHIKFFTSLIMEKLIEDESINEDDVNDELVNVKNYTKIIKSPGIYYRNYRSYFKILT
jgi:nucleotide sugar dehydrogenase